MIEKKGGGGERIPVISVFTDETGHEDMWKEGNTVVPHTHNPVTEKPAFEILAGYSTSLGGQRT